MSLDNNELIVEFVIESREHLADIENQLLAIEDAGTDIDVELVNTVFRAVHSIKGAAGFFGFTVLGELAHDLENVLNLVRNRQLVPDGAATNVMLRAADTLRTILDDIHHSNDVDIQEHLTALQKIVAGDIPEEVAHIEQTQDMQENNIQQPIQDLPETSMSIEDRLPEQEPEVESLANPETTTQATAVPLGHPISDVHSESDQQNQQADRRSPENGGRRTTDKTAGTVPPADTNIRVSVSVLDSLMNLAGELVLARNQLLQTVGTSDGGLDSVAARLDQVTSELQEAIMQTRMQAVGTVFGKFPRVVRDLSKQLGKQCQLIMEGEDVELDKSVIESIGDPLTHLIRNSVDHGIESPEVRAKSGKPAAGTIVLRAFHQAGKVYITVTDDGSGINVAKLKEKALALGIIRTDQAANMSDREALRLIFHPGFSLAEKVTAVSGRGVGMDVVKTNIEKIGGAVGIETEIGRGTSINIKLPLTLAIIPSLIVRCGANRFAIPQTSINELVRLKANELSTKIERVKQAEVFRLRGKLLPLVRLDAALGIKREEEKKSEAIHIIVVEAGHLQYGIVVDAVHDSEEIVVKPLGRHMQNSRCMAGATILGDGCVALILDVVGIASHAQLVLPDDDQKTQSDSSSNAAASSDSQHLLLFTNAPNEYFGIPMGLIARLERIRSDQIDSVGGQEVLQYRGGSLPLLSLEKIIKATPRQPSEKVYIVVFNNSGREVGLVVPELIDIREVSIAIDMVTLREPGVVGSLVVDKRTTRMLDLYDLTKLAHPEWFVDREMVSQHPSIQRDNHEITLLLAEDSTFFRKQVSSFLEDDGFKVVACEDGLIAWNLLRSEGDKIDLVITDLEMPNMNGFELARHIKDDAALSRLPVISLTSLASEDDMKRGKEAGIDDYQIKLDRERLLESVSKFLKAKANNDAYAMQTASPVESY